MFADSGFFRKLRNLFWPGSKGRKDGAFVTGRERVLIEDRLAQEALDPQKVNLDALNCKEVRQLSSDYLEEDLSSGLLASIKRHLGDCKNCNAFVDTLRKTVEMVKGLPTSRAPDKARKRILQVISKRQD